MNLSLSHYEACKDNPCFIRGEEMLTQGRFNKKQDQAQIKKETGQGCRWMFICVALLMLGLYCSLATATPTTSDTTNVTEIIKVAEQGFAKAQYYLGVMYENGKGVEQDVAKAVSWYRKAAEQGYAKAQFNLGGMYALGKGVEQDVAKAVRWYRKAAERGSARAQNKLRSRMF